MQPAPAGLTAAQVVALLQDSSALTLAAGLELVDLGLNVLEDISADLAGGSITRNSYAEMHATATLRVTRDLDWGAGLVRPYMTVTDGTLTGRWNLGVYHTSTPEHSTAESPPTYEVEGYDMLHRLNQPVGDAYAIATGAGYLATVEEILLGRGYTAYLIDQTNVGYVAPTARTWAFDDRVTWLTVVNDLLGSIGYAGIWSDWDGRLRCEPYVLPASRSVEWTYTDDAVTTMIGHDRRVRRDYFNAPNRWVFYRTNVADAEAMAEGLGMLTYQNDSVGDTSVQARGGLVVTKVVGVDTANQGSLAANAQAIIAADLDIPTIITARVSPNPQHWHFDRLLVQTADLAIADAQCTEWTLPLPPDLGDMSQVWRLISQ